MAKSLITDDLEHCIICGRTPVQIHHIMHGAHVNRKYAGEDGLIIPLCLRHHTGDWKNCIHGNALIDRHWKQIAQEKFEAIHGHDEWMKRYGKNYL